MGNPEAAALALRWLDLSPRAVRLLTAVHEAGHAVVAHTVGMGVERMHLTDGGSLDAHTTVDFRRGVGEVIPLPDQLAMMAAGFQAMFTWLDARGLENDDRSRAINYLSAGDIARSDSICAQVLPDASMQDGITPAANVLQRRWPTVMRLAYRLAAAGTLEGAELGPALASDPERLAAAARWYRQWRDVETSDRWYRRQQVTTNTGSSSSDSGDDREATGCPALLSSKETVRNSDLTILDRPTVATVYRSPGDPEAPWSLGLYFDEWAAGLVAAETAPEAAADEELAVFGLRRTSPWRAHSRHEWGWREADVEPISRQGHSEDRPSAAPGGEV